MWSMSTVSDAAIPILDLGTLFGASCCHLRLGKMPNVLMPISQKRQTSRQAVDDLQDFLEIPTLLALEIQGVSLLKMLTPRRAGFARNCS